MFVIYSLIYLIIYDFLSFIFFQILPILMEFIRGVPMVFVVVFYFRTGNETFLAFGILIQLCMTLLLTLMALVRTGEKNVGRLERLAR